MNAIYVLVDPETGRVGYVGRTDYPDRRWEDHWASKTPYGTTKERWLWSLYEKGVEPEMRIVEEVPGHAAKGHEHLWMVRLAAAGAQLTNSELPTEAHALLETDLAEARVVYEDAWYGLDLRDYQQDADADEGDFEGTIVGVGRSQRETVEILQEIIRELDSSGTGKGVPRDEIVERATEERISEARVDEILDQMKNFRGIIYDVTGQGHYRLVRE